MCMVKVKEKYFKTKYRPVGVLLKCLHYDYFKLGLQLKFRENKCYSSIIVNFHAGLHWKKKKIHQIKIYGERKWSWEEDRWLVHCHFSVAQATYAASHLRHFIQAIEVLHSWSVLFIRINNFDPVFPDFWIV
jgi:hypothetical protein